MSRHPHLKRMHPAIDQKALEAPTPLDNTVCRSTDRKIGPDSVTEGEVSALLNQNKAALGQDAIGVETNDTGEGQRNQQWRRWEVKASMGVRLMALLHVSARRTRPRIRMCGGHAHMRVWGCLRPHALISEQGGPLLSTPVITSLVVQPLLSLAL